MEEGHILWRSNKQFPEILSIVKRIHPCRIHHLIVVMKRSAVEGAAEREQSSKVRKNKYNTGLGTKDSVTRIYLGA
eukprot:scaffold116281_cov54-Attheya_sp.AAC.3